MAEGTILEVTDLQDVAGQVTVVCAVGIINVRSTALAISHTIAVAPAVVSSVVVMPPTSIITAPCAVGIVNVQFPVPLVNQAAGAGHSNLMLVGVG
jgi:hypothetical protein